MAPLPVGEIVHSLLTPTPPKMARSEISKRLFQIELD